MSPEVTAGFLVALTGLIPVLVAGVVRLLEWWRGVRTQTYVEGRQRHQDQLAEYRELFDRLREEVNTRDRDKQAVETETRRQIDILERRLNTTAARAAECERREARREARMEYYEDVMREAGIHFRPWSEMAGPDPPGPDAPDPPPEGTT